MSVPPAGRAGLTISSYWYVQEVSLIQAWLDSGSQMRSSDLISHHSSRFQPSSCLKSYLLEKIGEPRAKHICSQIQVCPKPMLQTQVTHNPFWSWCSRLWNEDHEVLSVLLLRFLWESVRLWHRNSAEYGPPEQSSLAWARLVYLWGLAAWTQATECAGSQVYEWIKWDKAVWSVTLLL